MKNINKFYKYFFALFILMACDEELRDLSFTDSIAPPSNVSAAYDLTQDNTGNVTITPTADGALSFEVYFGDSTTEPAKLGLGENVTHTYAEGSYNVKIVAINLKGDKVEATQPLVVSFKAPENLTVTIENDAAISKQVNVTATADFAATYEFHSGETGVTQPVATANIGDQLSYQYSTPGTYSVKVVAKGAAIATTEYTMDFEVTEILAPIASATPPPTRSATDVISIFSDTYTNVAGTDLYPNWGQSTQYTAFDLNGDAIIQYSNLNYQEIDIGSEVDASSMEMLHIDIWTADATSIDIYPLPNGVQPADERFVTKQLVANEWNSFDIPMTDFTSQGLPVNTLKQFKFVGSGTVFIDNIYFYKSPSLPFNGVTPITFEDNFTLSSF
ncbi:PKD domain-containing protein, partial [Polaribacter sp.]|uniref:PKD domain-containing protein n=1 Tax=Polaribacter sp. TaxID=1920175 RepID=UPI003F6A458C